MRGLGNIFYGLGAGMFLLALAVIWYRRRKNAPA
jgi:LPXTG-motif cell wall-anchored protein